MPLKIELSKNKLGLLSGDKEHFSQIREYFSVSNKAYGHNSRHVQPRTYCITPLGKFKVGLYEEIRKFCEKNQISLETDEVFLKKIKVGLNSPKVENLNKTYRNYQQTSILAALEFGRGVIVIPTAGGKTLIMAGVIKSFMKQKVEMRKILVVVPTLQLVHQTADDFHSYGLENISKWCGNYPYDHNSQIVVAGSQILMSSKTDLSVLNDVNLLLMDEVHQARRGNKINDVLKFINTDNKFGFTGTMPSEKIDIWNILGEFGKILHEEKTVSLKEKAFVSQFKIIILYIEHQQVPFLKIDKSQPAAGYREEIEFLMSDNRRNEIICNLASKLKENTLIMVDRIEHGNLLFQTLRNLSENRPVYFIQGDTEIADREFVRDLMESRRDVIVVAISKIFSTGINIPNLHNIIFASIGKSKIKIMQSIGRALRLHKTKNVANIFDIADSTHYGKKHVEERKKLYTIEKYEFTEKKLT